MNNNAEAQGTEMTGQPVRSLQYMLNQLAMTPNWSASR